MTDDVVAFLRARLDEDKETADAATARVSDGAVWSLHDADSEVRAASGLGIVQRTVPVAARHIARHDPARVLREVEAKRLLLDMVLPEIQGLEREVRERGEPGSTNDTPGALLRFFALPYADHPDYREEWRP